MTENLVEQIQNTQTLLETLSSEQSDLSAKMAISADNADSASLITLKHRANDLPIEIIATQIRLARLYLRRDEERLPLLQTEVAKLAEPIEGMQKKINDLQREFNIASGEVSNANENLRQVKLEIAERRRSIGGLVHEARNSKISPASLSMRGGG